MTQTDAILEMLETRPQGITPMDALNEVGCFRLAARVGELRHEGHNIVTVNETRDGRTYARYQLRPVVIPETEQRALWGDR